MRRSRKILIANRVASEVKTETTDLAERVILIKVVNKHLITHSLQPQRRMIKASQLEVNGMVRIETRVDDTVIGATDQDTPTIIVELI